MTVQKPTIEVAISRVLMNQYDFKDKVAVVVDLFRNTTTIAAALNHGVLGVIPSETIDETLTYKDKEGYIIAGERNAVKLEGWDYGNSPRDYEGDEVSGKTLVITSTNGTQCIKGASEADIIIAGSLVNLKAYTNYLRQLNKSIIFICAGWKGKVNFEDTMAAGAAIDLLQEDFELIDDTCFLALNAWNQAKDNLLKVTSEQATYFERINTDTQIEDMPYCLSLNSIPMIPVYNGKAFIPGLKVEDNLL